MPDTQIVSPAKNGVGPVRTELEVTAVADRSTWAVPMVVAVVPSLGSSAERR